MNNIFNKDLDHGSFGHKDLGSPLPDDRNAVSFSLPEWEDVIDYELSKERVVSKIQTGYPRFFFHPDVNSLHKLYSKKFADRYDDDRECIALLNKTVANYGKEYLNNLSANNGNDIVICDIIEEEGLFILIYNAEYSKEAKSFWQHSGYGVSSRQAYDILHGNNKTDYNTKAENIIKDRIAKIVDPSNKKNIVKNSFLFPCGMAAIYSIHHIIKTLNPEAKTIQLGFPYVDTLKIQENFGYGTHFINNDLDKLEEIISSEKISAVFCEFPSNPLLKTVNIVKLHEILSRYNVPLIADDTVGTFYNLDILKYSDIIVSSLTKSYSGTGNVMSGLLIANPESKIYDKVIEIINNNFINDSYYDDLDILEKNSRDFIDRIQQINSNAEFICDFLRSHDEIEHVYYPKFTDKDNYNIIKTENGGYGGLLSIITKDKDFAPQIYNKLTIAKGPSLGTNFTLCCPYTLLAHFDELDWAEENDIPSHLIRISIGLENKNDLLNIFKNSLKR